MINADCQNSIPRDLINRRPVRAPQCPVFPLLICFAQQILHLGLDQWLSMWRISDLRYILKNHVANRTPRSYRKQTKTKWIVRICDIARPRIYEVDSSTQCRHLREMMRACCSKKDATTSSTYHLTEADLGRGSGRTAQPFSARLGDQACSTAGGVTTCYLQALKTQ